MTESEFMSIGSYNGSDIDDNNYYTFCRHARCVSTYNRAGWDSKPEKCAQCEVDLELFRRLERIETLLRAKLA